MNITKFKIVKNLKIWNIYANLKLIGSCDNYLESLTYIASLIIENKLNYSLCIIRDGIFEEIIVDFNPELILKLFGDYFEVTNVNIEYDENDAIVESKIPVTDLLQSEYTDIINYQMEYIDLLQKQNVALIDVVSNSMSLQEKIMKIVGKK